MKRTARRADDPLNYIKVQCNIPQSLKYDVSTLSIFNFTEPIEKLNAVNYT